MIEKFNNFEEYVGTFFKIILPSILGVSLKIVTQVKREDVSPFRMMLAYIGGVGLAYLCAPVILDSVPKNYASIVIAVVAISADKILEYIIYKWDIDGILKALTDNIKQFLVNLIGGKK